MSRSVLKVAALHLRVKLGFKRHNLKRLQNMLIRLFESHDDIDILVLPPHPLTGPIIGYYNPERTSSYLRSFAERLQSPWGSSGFTVNTLSRIASEWSVSIISGPIVERAGPRLYLSVIYLNSRGEIVGRYRKITLSRVESSYSIGYGREPGIFTIDNRINIGVFADADILNPEIFRIFQLNRVNMIIGSLLPQKGGSLPVEQTPDGLLRPRRDVIRALTLTRSLETGLPLMLVGGVVEEGNGGSPLACSETLIVDPEAGVIESFTRTASDADTHLIVEVDPSKSVPRECDRYCEASLRSLCKIRRETAGKQAV